MTDPPLSEAAGQRTGVAAALGRVALAGALPTVSLRRHGARDLAGGLEPWAGARLPRRADPGCVRAEPGVAMLNCTSRPRAWLQHGHADDPAYHGLLLHVVDWAGRPQHEHAPPDMRVPDATPLPPARLRELRVGVERPPCADIVPRAGEDAVEARLFAIARRRFLRKMSELQALNVPAGPGLGRRSTCRDCGGAGPGTAAQ